MVGTPAFAGFISKLLFAQAAYETTHKLVLALVALAVSTVLNAVYFMKTVIRLYTPGWRAGLEVSGTRIRIKDQPLKSAMLVCFVILNLFLGLCSEPVVRLLAEGLERFA